MTSVQLRFHVSTQHKSSVLMAHAQIQVSVASSHQAYGAMPAAALLRSDVQMVLVITTAQRFKVVA